MNKQELTEIKKNFISRTERMVVNRIYSAYINPANEDEPILYSTNESTFCIPEDRYDYLMVYLASILKGRIGKGNKEYFIRDPEKQDLFYEFYHSELNMANKDIINNFVNNFIENYSYMSPYALFIAHCTYSFKTKENDDDFANYNFIISSICPIENTNEGLIYNDKEFINDIETKKSVQSPINGFIYPTFSERSAAVNNILIYDKTPNRPNTSIVDLCGANFTYSNLQQKTKFDNMLNSVINDKLDYELATSINDTLNEKLVMQSLDSEPPTLKKEEVVNLLIEAGVNPDYKEYLDKSYESTFGTNSIDTNAIVTNKSKIQVGGFTISFNNSLSNMLSTQIINGKNSIVITVDGDIDLNGLTIK